MGRDSGGPRARARDAKPASPKPVVKWAGGKARLTERLITLMPKGRFSTYAEPFCGGAAMFFALASQRERRFDRAILSDKNEELVALYRAIQTDVVALQKRLRAYSDKHAKLDAEGRREHFYEVREKTTSRLGIVERGARLVFLNKTCFNGLWRVNASGQFNVPFGRYERPKILDVPALELAHRALQDVDIRLGDFADVTRELSSGDFVYFDPPYVPVSRTSNFTAYAASGFGAEEQRRLKDELVELRARRVDAMLSNASSSETRALYHDKHLHLTTVEVARSINSDPRKRGDVDELVVTNYKPAARKNAKTETQVERVAR